MPEMSVIIAAYNQRRHLPALLTCLQRQAGAPAFEVLVCDDGSGDGMLEAVRRSVDLDIRYLWQPDNGFRLSRSRNNGIRCAQGRILIFVDGDEIVGPDFLAGHATAHADGDRVMAVGGRRPASVIGDVGEIDIPALWREMERWGPSESGDELHAWLKSQFPWMAVTGGNCSVTAGEAVRFDEQFEGWGFEDREFAYRLAIHNGYEVRFAAGSEAVHLYWNGEVPSGNPLDSDDPAANEALVLGGLTFQRRHPEADVEMALGMLGYFRWNEARGAWTSEGAERPERPVVDVLLEAARWESHHRSQTER